MTFIEFLAAVALALGTFFSVVGIIGMVRMPDVYSRIHAAGKVSTLGILGLLAGATLLMPEIALRAAALGLFLVMTSPVAAHAIASAAHRQGVARTGAIRDDLGMIPSRRSDEAYPD
jgi:multicomponent Na+:H+ antiporter subunit G